MKWKVIGGISLALMVFILSCQSDDQLEFSRYYSSGRLIYQNRCQNCHGANGQGLLALMPPLTDSVYLKANKQVLGCYIKYGLKGKLAISGKTFDSVMPANDFAAIDIAEVLTYVTNSFGNKMGVVTAQQVENDLKNCK